MMKGKTVKDKLKELGLTDKEADKLISIRKEYNREKKIRIILQGVE